MGIIGDCRGQATVEMVVIFPVAIVVAVIMINTVLFLSECAAFDRSASQAIRTYATSPTSGQTTSDCASAIASELRKSFGRRNLQVSVSIAGGSSAHTAYTATLGFKPTLFGLGLKSEVMGVALPSLKHSTSLTVETYKPGVFL